MPRTAGGLTIGAVASLTEVSVPVLRAWEQRYGFPRPTRSASGHRRYADHDVEQILRVLREREAGLSLEAAIARVRRAEEAGEPSVFAGLRRHRPGLAVHVLTKRSMLAVSHAIEDECCAEAERPVLVAGFQRERHYRAAEGRWRELARTATGAVVLADFAAHRLAGARPYEVALPQREPLRREWIVVCDAPGAAACLAGWERPGQEAVPPAGRRYEAVWTVEPDVVRRATRIALGAARRHAPGLDVAELLMALADERPADPEATVRRATALTNRIVAYLGQA